MATDTAVLELLVRWFQIAVSTEEGTVEGVSQDEAQQIVDLVEAGEAGFKLGLRGRELVNAAMSAVRFDEVGVEASAAIVQTMIDERQDAERLNDLERFLADGDLDRIYADDDGAGDIFVVQLDGSRKYAHGKGVSLRSALDNLRDILDARDQARDAATAQAPEA